MNAPDVMERERILELARLLGRSEDEIRSLLSGTTATMKAAAAEWGLRYKAEAGEDALSALVLKALKRKAQGARGALEGTIAGLGWF